MSGHHLNIVCQAVNNGRCYFRRHLGLSNQWFTTTSFLPWNATAWTRNAPLPAGVKSYSTTAEDLTKPQAVPKKKEQPNARKVIGHVGRMIPYNVIQVLNNEGKNMGQMLKRDVMRMLEEQNLKLISVTENADPPVYKLLTGKQLSEQQKKLREKQKTAPSSGPINTKEISILASIAQHDLDVKMKRLIYWIEKKCHVQVTVLNSRTAGGPDKVAVLQQIIEGTQDHATCLSQAKERKDGRGMVCILRPWSRKELQKRLKDLELKKQNEPATPDQTENPSTVPQEAGV